MHYHVYKPMWHSTNEESAEAFIKRLGQCPDCYEVVRTETEPRAWKTRAAAAKYAKRHWNTATVHQCDLPDCSPHE